MTDGLGEHAQVEKLLVELQNIPEDGTHSSSYSLSNGMQNGGTHEEHADHGGNLEESRSRLMERIASEMNRLKFYVARAQVHLLSAFQLRHVQLGRPQRCLYPYFPNFGCQFCDSIERVSSLCKCKVLHRIEINCKILSSAILLLAFFVPLYTLGPGYCSFHSVSDGRTQLSYKTDERRKLRYQLQSPNYRVITQIYSSITALYFLSCVLGFVT